MAELKIRLYEAGDEAGIIALFNSVFPTQVTPAFWKWKYADNPAGFPAIAVAILDSRIVGHVSFNPVRMVVDGQVLLGSQSVDLIVDEKRGGLARGRYLARIWKFLEERMLESRYLSFTFGFPMPHFQPLTHRIIGAEPVCQVRQLVKIRNWAYLLRRPLTGRPALLRPIQQLGRALQLGRRIGAADDRAASPPARLAGFDVRFDRLWEEVAVHFNIATVRDRRYLSWRYAHPDYRVYAVAEGDRLYGCVITRTATWTGWRIGYIADLWALDPAIAARLARAAVAQLDRERVDVIRCWMAEQSPYDRVVRQLGFIPRPTDYKLVLRRLATAVPGAVLQDPARWYYTLGDSDAI